MFNKNFLNNYSRNKTTFIIVILFNLLFFSKSFSETIKSYSKDDLFFIGNILEVESIDRGSNSNEAKIRLHFNSNGKLKYDYFQENGMNISLNGEYTFQEDNIFINYTNPKGLKVKEIWKFRLPNFFKVDVVLTNYNREELWRVLNSKVKNNDIANSLSNNNCSIDSFSLLLNCSVFQIEKLCGYQIITEQDNHNINARKFFKTNFFNRDFFRIDIKNCDGFGKPLGLTPDVSLLKKDTSKEINVRYYLNLITNKDSIFADAIKVNFYDVTPVQKNQLFVFLEKKYGKNIYKNIQSPEKWTFFDNYKIGLLEEDNKVSLIYSASIISNYFKNEVIKKSKLKPQNNNQL